MTPTALDDFIDSLSGADLLTRLRAGIIGEGAPVPGPFGAHPLVYADYVASGRALMPIETFMLERVLPYYANSHTEASYCGEFATRLRRAARALIARSCGADAAYATIFAGSGATAGLNRLVHLLGVADAVRRGERPVVFIGPYEHHSNILPWRESGAEIIEIPEDASGGPDVAVLEAALGAVEPGRLCVGSFSAASNVTGILTDVDTVTRVLKRHGALSVWDYAGGGPYLAIAMEGGTDREKDAVVVSTHKFLGGPGASGVLIVRKGAVQRTTPVLPGGGTVRFVSPWTHDYTGCLESREEAGTPNVVGDIRAALCFAVKAAIGQDTLDARHAALRARALATWSRNPAIEIVGHATAPALPIFSFRVRDLAHGGYIHQQLFTRMLSDRYGIQARGGCACAGPYAHRLLSIDATRSDAIRRAILAGEETEKPGWTRLNFSVLADDGKADKIIAAVDELARDPHPVASHYVCDRTTARFRVAETDPAMATAA
ncbi:NifS-like protein [Ameyamaea chiangmaiensis NBRC 103196]|uniref:Aminotransferase class V-fold PLP-dependent enzyme n=1 Tax=Ameyamaea chiangmaiensis TaxID=442969 RepID=A0A850P6H8_9PROT|nr:aminotransferase class V-fold PLP-dependent enzyme [Ameyamaea chiangmaiensis]MBS4075560.1 aminotransferase class V-fold PLP-dependent enzyme [Ameyamaea chiangmaiensis]NVN40245.1 aminotransferase class V-fold PLP-dependent enzyme [Ameyamaea chiangmaiensis]GBQ69313.1 NifS-like protein [Ameyamaea chiangmaiensis NBRC 103196]